MRSARMRLFVGGVVLVLLSTATARAQQNPGPQTQQTSPAPAYDQVLDRIIQHEAATIEELKRYSPLVETYIQLQRPEKRGSAGVENDLYFLGKSDLSKGVILHTMAGEDKKKKGRFYTRVFTGLSFSSSMEYNPEGFLEEIYLDRTLFNRQTYRFDYLRREFLGEVRCLVFDISPLSGAPKGRFRGRIWVEDRDFAIVRFNGHYEGSTSQNRYFHFDSWRLNVAPGKWLPAYVYSEESEGQKDFFSGAKANFKAQTRLWGYQLGSLSRQDEFSQILIEAQNPVRDDSDSSRDRTPVEAQRMWDRQAEDNVLERLEKVGLLAPAGEVDKILGTVINNLQVTNNLDIEPPIRARILLTSTLEAFTIGNTIVLSRGMVDVLPDEPSLAVVLAQQFGHILAGHEMDSKFAFFDNLIFPDEQTIRRMNFHWSDQQLAAAAQKGLELLKNSPYKGQFASAGLFLATLNARAKELPHLIQANMSNGVIPQAELLAAAPPLNMEKKEQVGALPLGSRVKLDPWTCKVEMVHGKPVALVSAREKMPFEVSPFMLYLIRYREPQGQPQSTSTVTKPETPPQK